MRILFGTQTVSERALGRAGSEGQRGHLAPSISLESRTNFGDRAQHVDFFAQSQKLGLVKRIGKLSRKVYRGRRSGGNHGVGSTLNESRFNSSVSPDIENNFSGHNKLLKLGLTRAAEYSALPHWNKIKLD